MVPYSVTVREKMIYCIVINREMYLFHIKCKTNSWMRKKHFAK